MYVIQESSIYGTPKKIKDSKGIMRFEAILQTCNDVNRNNRIYTREGLDYGINNINHRIKEKSLLGEMDHPIPTGNRKVDMVRQFTVKYDRVSHVFLELGWDGNKVISILETTDTPKGRILRGLAKQGIPVGFSFRGMGEVRDSSKRLGESINIKEIIPPVHVVTWDCVSQPSHKIAKLIRINESDISSITDEFGEYIEESVLQESNGLICLNDGRCYLPNVFDKLVEQKVFRLRNKFKI